jgi:predicted DnaQ family exonuclease/DinG family helicase
MSIFNFADDETKRKLLAMKHLSKKNIQGNTLRKTLGQTHVNINGNIREKTATVPVSINGNLIDAAPAPEKSNRQKYQANWSKIPDFVAVDIETTGLSKTKDRITEIAAIKFVDGKISEEFSTLINPKIDIPQKITQLTGIDNEIVKDAPEFVEIMDELIAFVGRLAICGHNVDFDISFLNAEIKRNRGKEINNWNIDTLILSRIILELEEGYALTRVANHLNISLENAHRALDDARASGLIAVRLIPKIKDVPVLSRARIVSNSVGFTKKIFERTLTGYIPPKKIKYEVVPNVKPLKPNGKIFEVSNTQLKKYFNSKLGQVIRRYRSRPEQLEFAQIVAGALNKGNICAIEAGTGTGKTMGYLVPAMLAAIGKNERIVISTATKQLQNQLIEKDLPALAITLEGKEGKISAAVLKGKNNYICRKAFEKIISGDVPGISPKERGALLPIIKWYEKTKTGDIDEQNAFHRRGNKQLWDMLSTKNRHCNCNCEHNHTCFLVKARRYAMAANIVVVNHAFFYSDIVSGNEIMQNAAAIIFDEAHRLEETGYYSLQTEIDTHSLGNAVENFQHIHTVLYNITKAIPAEEAEDKNNRDFIDDVIKLKHIIYNFRKASENFLETISQYLIDNADEKSADQTNSILTKSYRDNPFKEFDGLKGMMVNISEFTEILRLMRQVYRDRFSADDNIDAQISAGDKMAQQLKADMKYLSEAQTVGDLFWIEGPPSKKWVKLTGTTTNIKNFLTPFWQQFQKPVIFTSATLSPTKDIGYFADRVGISDLNPVLKQFTTEIIGENLFFGAALDTPEINTPEFNVYTAQIIKDLSAKFQKNTLVLFTNNENLEQVYNELCKDGKNPLVFAQGISGNNAWIQRQMRDVRGAVLLGSGSFWEGVDMPGDQCEILIIPKLPFPVPTHPLQKQLAANAESDGKNGFMNYSLPETLLKFRQGAGRLIRKSDDMGAFLVLDSRIVHKPYGKFFVDLMSSSVASFSKNVMNFTKIEETFESLEKLFAAKEIEDRIKEEEKIARREAWAKAEAEKAAAKEKAEAETQAENSEAQE